MNKDVAILITSDCGEPHSLLKQHMTKVICSKANNDFQVNGEPKIHKTHGIAELTLLHNAMNILLDFGIKYVFKLTYDNNPTCNFAHLIKKCKSHNKKLVSAKWGQDNTVGTMGFFCEIPFFQETLSYDEAHRCDYGCIEVAWYDSIAEKGLLQETYCYPHYGEFYECGAHVEFSHMGGTQVSDYPY